MPTSVNRFALSPLSKANKDVAVNGEMMLDKTTGQIVVKTIDGDIISYDNLSRTKSHLNELSLLAQNNGLRGSILSMDFENFELPSLVANDTNFLTTKVTVKVGNLKRFMFSVDVDTVLMSQTTTHTEKEPTVFIYFEFDKAGAITNRTISLPLSEFNSTVFKASDYFTPGTDLSGYTLSLTGLKIKKNDDYLANDKVKHILHNMLAVVE